jgi:hypothetical protein
MPVKFSSNQILTAGAILNVLALFGLWRFGHWIIKADDFASLNRWLLCIVASGTISGLAALWLIFRRKKGLALCAIFAAVPLWTLITTALVVLEVLGIAV